MGRFDRRHSLKMKRRKSQAKKAARTKKVAAAAKASRQTKPKASRSKG